MISRRDELRLNRFAQGVLTADEAGQWFAALPVEAKREALQWLAIAILEASYVPDDVSASVARSGLKPTFTPVVVTMKGNVHKVIHLPENELGKGFVLLLGILSIADERRRKTKCINGCSHWWHQDLSKDESQLLTASGDDNWGT